MKPREFYDRVNADEDLEYLGVLEHQGDDVVGVRYLGEWRGTVWILPPPFGAILGSSWEQLREVLTLRREPCVLFHQSRIVGYYSRIDNWNRSKLGELRDRHRGDYAVDPQMDLLAQPTPDELLEDLARAAGAGDRRMVCGIGEGPRHG